MPIHDLIKAKGKWGRAWVSSSAVSSTEQTIEKAQIETEKGD